MISLAGLENDFASLATRFTRLVTGFASLAAIFSSIETVKVILQVQGDQLYMAVCFWYLVKYNLSSVRVYFSVHWISHFFTRYQNTTAIFI